MFVNDLKNGWERCLKWWVRVYEFHLSTISALVSFSENYGVYKLYVCVLNNVYYTQCILYVCSVYTVVHSVYCMFTSVHSVKYTQYTVCIQCILCVYRWSLGAPLLIIY